MRGPGGLLWLRATYDCLVSIPHFLYHKWLSVFLFKLELRFTFSFFPFFSVYWFNFRFKFPNGLQSSL